MLPINTEGPWGYTSGEAITCTKGACMGVAFDSAGKIVKSGADTTPVGVIRESVAAADLPVLVYPLRGKIWVIAAAAITLPSLIKSAAAGKFTVDASQSANTLGSAASAASGDTVAFEANFG